MTDLSDAPAPFSAKLPRIVECCRDRAASPTFGTLVVLVASRVAEALPAYLAACPGDTRLRYVFQAAQEAHEGRGSVERLEAAYSALNTIDETLSDDTGEAARLAVFAVAEFMDATWDDALWLGALLTADHAVAAMERNAAARGEPCDA